VETQIKPSRQTKNVLATTSERSWKLTLNGILTATAQVMRKELTSGELLLWERLLANLQIEGLKWAFTEHLRSSKYFPVPAEITELYATWSRAERDKQKAAEEREQRAEDERRRARGEMCGIEILHDFAKQLSPLRAMPAPPAVPKRRSELQSQKVRIMKAIANVGKQRRI
jgi:hypothetical protein